MLSTVHELEAKYLTCGGHITDKTKLVYLDGVSEVIPVPKDTTPSAIDGVGVDRATRKMTSYGQ